MFEDFEISEYWLNTPNLKIQSQNAAKFMLALKRFQSILAFRFFRLRILNYMILVYEAKNDPNLRAVSITQKAHNLRKNN